MPTFSSCYSDYEIRVKKILEGVPAPSLLRTGELLAKAAAAPLDLTELAELLEIGREPGAEECFEMLRASVCHRFRRQGGNRLRYIAPIYISSHCADACGYCNFSALRRTTVRKRLSIEDLEGDLSGLFDAGARVIEIVLATDPALDWPMLARYISRTSALLKGERGSGVLLCSDYLPAEAYVKLREAGLWGIVQWDETLDRQVYQHWHAASPRKRHFEERVDNHDRALAAGLEVATGALFGLGDLRYEALMQIAKARFLEQEHGRGPFVFGTPRLKPIGERSLSPSSVVPDRAYETALMVYKLAISGIGRWLQTRETFDLNLRNLTDGDVFTYRCGEVRPGGYGNGPSSSRPGVEGQFSVNELTREMVEAKLTELAFEIDYTWIGGDASSK